MKNAKLMKIFVLVVGLVFAVRIADAAFISWSSKLAEVEGSVGQTLQAGLFDSSGIELLLADNYAGASMTLDGINFEGIDLGPELSFAGFGQAGTFQDTGFLHPDSGVGSVGLSDLIIGREYRIEALIYDGRSSSYGKDSFL